MDGRLQDCSVICVHRLNLSIDTDHDDGIADPAAQWKVFSPLKSCLNIIHKGFYLYHWNFLSFQHALKEWHQICRIWHLTGKLILNADNWDPPEVYESEFRWEAVGNLYV